MSILAVVADGKSWANFHRSLSGGLFFISLWLLEKINRGFVIRRLEKIGRFFQTRPAHRASQVYVPGAGSIEWLFARFVRHRNFPFTKFVSVQQCLCWRDDLRVVPRINGTRPRPS